MYVKSDHTIYTCTLYAVSHIVQHLSTLSRLLPEQKSCPPRAAGYFTALAERQCEAAKKSVDIAF